MSACKLKQFIKSKPGGLLKQSSRAAFVSRNYLLYKMVGYLLDPYPI